VSSAFFVIYSAAQSTNEKTGITALIGAWGGLPADWIPANVDACCSWTGITCNNGAITAM